MPSPELLTDVLEAHGGLENWRRTTTLNARLLLGGPFWAGRGWPACSDVIVTLATQHEHIEIVYRDHVSVFDVGPERLTLTTLGGEPLEARDGPRSSFPRSDRTTTPWDAVQLAYFHSTASWNYLTEPFLFAQPGVTVREIEPWAEHGDTWRRLAVTFPPSNANHNAEQVFYYDAGFLLRRMDYSPEVTGSPPVAHYTGDHVIADGFVFPSRRRVHLHDAAGVADQSLAVITIDVIDLAVARR